MRPFVNILVWIAVGLVVGLALFMAFAPPPAAQAAPNSTSNGTVINGNESGTAPPPSNATQPPPTTLKQAVDITLISAPSCDRCNSIDQLLLQQTEAEIGKSPVAHVGALTILNSTDPQAQALLSKYNVTRLPALFVSSAAGFTANDTQVWTTQLGTIEPDGVLVQRMVYPPYYDLANGSIVGMVKAISIDAPSSCGRCMNSSDFANSLAQAQQVQMTFAGNVTFPANSSEAQALIARYNITELPTVLFSLDISAYPAYQQIKPLGTEVDGWFVLRQVHPPFVDLSKNGSVQGLVSLIQIVNGSCTDCFSIDSLSDYVANSAGIELVNKTTYDVNSSMGATLVDRYKIASLPTMLFSPEISAYPHFQGIWTSQNNTVEADGWYIFRAYPLLQGVYQNITLPVPVPQNSTQNSTGQNITPPMGGG